MSDERSPKKLALAFLCAAATLFLQILLHRIISAKLLNNFAFLVISLTMLGFAFSGALLTRWLPLFVRRAEDAYSSCAALFVLSTLGVTLLFYRAELAERATTRPEFVAAFLSFLPYALLFALPFAFAGLILGALLSSPGVATRRVYFADLVGSACGAFAVIPAISAIGVEKSLFLGCGLLLLTVVLFVPKHALARSLSAAAIVALAGSAGFEHQLFAMRPAAGSMLANPAFKLLYTQWDPIARIEVSDIPPPDPQHMQYPCLIGTNAAFLQRFKRCLTQNNFAFTYAVDYDGNPASLDGIEETIYSAAYHATSVKGPNVAIIGVGGGFDVLNALYFNASRVTAVEINAATVSVLTDRFHGYFKHWVDDPRLHLVLDEGRHYLTTSDERFDVLQLSGVDSYAGTAAAANVFSESYLYTQEAFDLYLSRLTEDGILNVMRLEKFPPREMLKILVTAVEALRRAGVEHPREHIAIVTDAPNRNFTAILVKKTPFTAAEVQRLVDWAEPSQVLALSHAPGITQPQPDSADMYERFLSSDQSEVEARFVQEYPFNIVPAQDDRPFFFRHSYWWHLFPSTRVIREATPVMEYSVIILFLVIALCSLLCVWVPLQFLAARGNRHPASFRWFVFFAGTGLGYLAIEVALLQKFGLFLGHPNYALSVVLAALLFSSGLGSFLSSWTVRTLGKLRFVAYPLALLILGECALAFPRLEAMARLPFGIRAAIVIALTAPIGICLGTFLPTALERLKVEAPELVPWAWGVNGIFSVLAPVLAVSLSISFGITALFLSALPIYLLTAFAFPAEPQAG